ncbi:MAG: hypothetical protein IPM34_05580 [Saprospiraceae bacterium]|nr:hypothetical protein [Saprospiraceae bacterium]
MIQLVEVGKTFKSYGLSGSLRFDIQETFLELLKKERVVFFMVEGNAVPFFLEDRCDPGEGFLEFDDIHDPESAKLLSHVAFYMDGNRMGEELNVDDSSELEDDIRGFYFFDEQSKQKGKVMGVEDFPGQILILVAIKGKEYYVPLREEWISELDFEKKSLKMRLPNGMFE